mgnify:FL=1
MMNKIWNLIEDIMSRVRKLENNGNTWSWEQIEDSFSLAEQAIIELNNTVLDQQKTIEKFQNRVKGGDLYEIKDERDKLREKHRNLTKERNMLKDLSRYDKKAMKELHGIIEELMNPWYKKLWNRLKSLKCPKISIEW